MQGHPVPAVPQLQALPGEKDLAHNISSLILHPHLLAQQLEYLSLSVFPIFLDYFHIYLSVPK